MRDVRRAGQRLEVPDAQRVACDDFARGGVRPLGESVPAALVRGFLIGLAADLDQILSASMRLSLNAALFTPCRHAPSAPDMDTSALVARP